MTVIRRATETDLKFVRDSWVRSYRMSHNAGPIPMGWYTEVYERLIGELLQRPGVEVLVACSPKEAPPDDVFGWVCVEHDVEAPVKVLEHGRRVERFVRLEQPVLHFVYVKQPFRQHGVGKRLVKTAGIDPSSHFVHTFKTGTAAKLVLRGKAAGASFDPRPVRFPKSARYEPDAE